MAGWMGGWELGIQPWDQNWDVVGIGNDQWDGK